MDVPWFHGSMAPLFQEDPRSKVREGQVHIFHFHSPSFLSAKHAIFPQTSDFGQPSVQQ